MPLTEPRTSAEWQDLRNKLRTAKAEDYPEVDPAGFRKFRKVVVTGSGNLVGLPMILTIGFLFITEYILGIINWGAIGWLLGLVVGAGTAGLLNPTFLRMSEQKALRIGREIGVFTTGERGAGEPARSGLESAPGGVPVTAAPRPTVGRPPGAATSETATAAAGETPAAAGEPGAYPVSETGARGRAPAKTNKLIIALIVAIPVALIAGILLTVAGMRLLDRGPLRPATGGGGGSGSPASKSWKSTWPSGKIVFHSGRTGENYYRIFTMDVASGSSRQLTAGTEWDFRPSWSPDGRRIAFTRSTDEGKRAEIFIMDEDGSSLTQVTKTGNVVEFGSTWSPDGTKLLTTVGDISDTEGKTIEIEVMGLDGSQRRALTSNNVADFDPAWSPDGSSIAFVRGGFDFSGVMVMDADGSNTRKLTEVRAIHESPAWSPDGETIAYVRGPLETPAIWTMNADGSGKKQLTAGRDPVWSPDGEWIMLSENMELHVIRPGGGERKTLTTGKVAERYPSWRK